MQFRNIIQMMEDQMGENMEMMCNVGVFRSG